MYDSVEIPITQMYCMYIQYCHLFWVFIICSMFYVLKVVKF